MRVLGVIRLCPPGKAVRHEIEDHTADQGAEHGVQHASTPPETAASKGCQGITAVGQEHLRTPVDLLPPCRACADPIHEQKKYHPAPPGEFPGKDDGASEGKSHQR